MDHVTRLVSSVVRRAYEQGGANVDAALVERTAEWMVLRREEVVAIDATPLGAEPGSVREVG